MNSKATDRIHAKAFFRKMLAGKRVVASHETLDAAVEQFPNLYSRLEIVSARNRNQCGIHDGFVAWARTKVDPPVDLEHREGYALASADRHFAEVDLTG